MRRHVDHRWRPLVAHTLIFFHGIRRILRLGLPVAASVSLVGSALAKDETADTRRSPTASNSALYGPGDVYANIPAKDEFGRDQLAMFRLWNPDPVGLHEANLNAINPMLAEVVRRARADHPGLLFVIGSGRRDDKQQRKAVAWGWSRTMDSPHRVGNAVDLWPLDAQGRVLFDPPTYSQVSAAMRQAAAKLRVSLRWGGHFHSFKDMDRSHFELATPYSGYVRRTR